MEEQKNEQESRTDNLDKKEKPKRKGKGLTAVIVIFLIAVAGYFGYDIMIARPLKEAQTAFIEEKQNYNNYYSQYVQSIDEFNDKADAYNAEVNKLKNEISATNDVINSGTPYDESLVESANTDINSMKKDVEVEQERLTPEEPENFSDEGMKTDEINAEIEEIQSAESSLEEKTTDIDEQADSIRVPDFSDEIQILKNHQKAIKDSIEVYVTLMPDKDDPNKADDDNPGIYDPFENLELSFSGTAPGGKAKVGKKSDDGIDSTYKFTIDKDSDLSNGDTVTVTVVYSGTLPTDHKTIQQLNQDLIQKYGKTLSPSEKTFTVSGLSYYLTDIAQLESGTLEKMKKYGIDGLREYLSDNYGNEVTLTSSDYLGYYFLVGKKFDDGLLSKDYNKLYLLFDVTEKIDLGEKGDFKSDFEYIYSIEYDGLINLADDTNGTDLSSFERPSESFTIDSDVKKNILQNYTYKFYGYKDIDMAYNKIVVSQAEDYKYSTDLSR